MIVFSLVVFDDGKVCVKDADGGWWCGKEYGWCHENSSYFQMTPDCHARPFDSIAAASAFARKSVAS